MTEEEKLWTGGIDKKIFWFGRARCVFVSRIYVWQRPKYSCGRSENILEYANRLRLEMMYTESSGTAADFYEPEIFQLS